MGSGKSLQIFPSLYRNIFQYESKALLCFVQKQCRVSICSLALLRKTDNCIYSLTRFLQSLYTSPTPSYGRYWQTYNVFSWNILLYISFSILGMKFSDKLLFFSSGYINTSLPPCFPPGSFLLLHMDCNWKFLPSHMIACHLCFTKFIWHFSGVQLQVFT